MMDIYIAIRNSDYAIMKLFVHEPLCDKYINDYNKKETEQEWKLHKETYHIEQKEVYVE